MTSYEISLLRNDSCRNYSRLLRLYIAACLLHLKYDSGKWWQEAILHTMLMWTEMADVIYTLCASFYCLFAAEWCRNQADLRSNLSFYYPLRKIADIFACWENLIDFNETRLHWRSWTFIRIREFFPACQLMAVSIWMRQCSHNISIIFFLTSRISPDLKKSISIDISIDSKFLLNSLVWAPYVTILFTIEFYIKETFWKT